MLKKLQVAIGATLMGFSVAHADVAGDMTNFFDSIGYSANINKPQAYQAQGSGYFTGGSMFLRNGVRNVQIVHVDLPSVDAGCGGINLFTGGFSYINLSEIVSSGKQILAGAAGYLFQLAMQTELPNVTDALTTVRDWAREINDMAMNTCQVGQSLVQSIPWQNRGMKDQVCKDIGSRTGKFSDWAAGIQDCKKESTNVEMNKNAPNADENLTNVNIVWKYIHNKDTYGATIDKQLAETFMSITGTIIFDEKGNQTTLPSVVNNAMLEAFLNGGDIEDAYKCDEEKACLKPTKSKLTIPDAQSFVSKVQKTLNDIAIKVSNDTTALNADEISFLSLVSLPVMRMMQTSLEANGKMDIDKYSQLIATDLVLGYIKSILDYVQSSVPEKYTGEVNRSLRDSYFKVNKFIVDQQTTLYQRIAAEQALINATIQQQQQITSAMTSSLQQNINY